MSSALLRNIPRPALKWIPWLGLILGATLLVFWNDLQIVLNEGLVAEGYSHVLLLPFVLAYLIYRKRHVLAAMQGLPDKKSFGDIWTVVGGSLLLTSFVVYFYSTETTYALEWRIIVLPVFITGMVLVLFGYRFWREIAVPIAFLAFFDPYFIQLTNPYWELLANISAIGAHDLLASLGYATQLTTTLTGPVIQTVNPRGTQYAFDIGVGSSGLQSLIGYTLFAALVAYIFVGSIPKRLVLFVLGYPLLVGMNIIRIAGIIGLTNFVGQTAGDIFHLTGGLFLVFIGSVLLLLMGQHVLKLGFGPSLGSIKPCQHRIRGDRFCFQCGGALPGRGPSLTRSRFTGLLVVIAGTLLLLSILTPAYAQTSSLTKVDLGSQSPAVLTQLLPNIPGWNLSFVYRDTATQAALEADAALIFVYQRNNPATMEQQTIYAIVQVGPIFHTWEDSLYYHPKNLGLPYANVSVLQPLTVVGSGPLPTSVVATFFVFRRPGLNLTEAVLEWTSRGTFTIDGTKQERFLMMSIYQNVPALVNAGLITNSSDLKQVRNVYLPFARSIVYAQGLAERITYIRLNFPITYGLLGSILVPGTLGIAGHSVESSYRRRVVKRIVRGVASKGDILMLKSVQSADKSGRGLLTEIRNAYAALGGPKGSAEQFVVAINRASELGIVEPAIVEQFGAPYWAWKLKDGAGTQLGNQRMVLRSIRTWLHLPSI
jgi:exosortase